MPWLLEYKLRKLAKLADPAPEFVRVLEQRIHQAMGHPVWWIRGRGLAMNAIAILTVVATSGTGVYAYTSDDVLPEHPLYLVRLKIEKVEAAIPPRGEIKTNVSIKHLKRRVREQQIIQQKQLPLTKRNVKVFVKQLKKTVEATDTLPQPLMQDVAHIVDQLEQKQDATLNPPEVYELLHQADQTVDKLNKKLELASIEAQTVLEDEHVQEHTPTRALEITHGDSQ